MERIGHLLADSAFRQEDQATVQAAAVVAATTAAIRQHLHLWPHEAKAISYRRQEVLIHVSHGAIAGQIMIQQEQLLNLIHQTVKKIYRRRPPIVTRLIVRQS